MSKLQIIAVLKVLLKINNIDIIKCSLESLIDQLSEEKKAKNNEKTLF